MRYLALITLILFFFSTTVALAAKPDTPPNKGKGSGKDFEPISGSVCIDAGHGGSGIGTANGDLLEKDVNLRVAFLLQERLENNGNIVFMTRTDNDTTLSNADRY
ncbi:N-acetylmuramoyl-L-alanine amidase, partial [Patescibacteria group bacterium]|nr:N-acetylmuramoyl-L-alanine amidase [Patescibacteria group bacterium]